MSNIDISKPAEGNATTESVRTNFAIAKQEIEQLQAASGAARAAAWLYQGNDAQSYPGYGGIAIETAGAVRYIAMTSVDADGAPHYFDPMLAGDTIIITNDPTSGAPTAFARYLLTADPINYGSYWYLTCKRTDTTGSTAPPPIDTRIRVTGIASASPTDAPDLFPALTVPLAKSNLYASCWQSIGTNDTAHEAPGIVPMDQWSLHPFIAPHTGKIIEIRVSNSDYTECNFRVAIAQAKPSNPYQPQTILFDSGEWYDAGNDLISFPTDFTVTKGTVLYLMFCVDRDVPANIYQSDKQPTLLLNDAGAGPQHFYAFGFDGGISFPVEDIGSVTMAPVNTLHLPIFYMYEP